MIFRLRVTTGMKLLNVSSHFVNVIPGSCSYRAHARHDIGIQGVLQRTLCLGCGSTQHNNTNKASIPYTTASSLTDSDYKYNALGAARFTSPNYSLARFSSYQITPAHDQLYPSRFAFKRLAVRIAVLATYQGCPPECYRGCLG